MADGNAVVEVQEYFQCTATTSFDNRFCSALASKDSVGSFWTSTGLFPQHVRLEYESSGKGTQHAVCGLSADFWQVKEARISVLGAELQMLHSVTIEPPAPSRGDSPQFCSEHVAIPTTEACRAILIDIISGYDTFCAIHKCRLLGKRIHSIDSSSQPRGMDVEGKSEKPNRNTKDGSAAVEDQPRLADKAVNHGQRGATVVAAVYGSGNSRTVQGNHTVVVPRGRGKRRGSRTGSD